MTAQYIIHKKTLIENTVAYGETCQVYYPVKANSNSKLIKIIDPLIQGYEVDSIYHLYDLLYKYKVDPDRIIFSAVVKPTNTISKLIRWGVTKFVVDDVSDLNSILSLAHGKKMTFLIRIDVTEFISVDGLILKWGASLKETAVLKEIILKTGQDFIGYSFYLPQEINTAHNIKYLVSSLKEAVDFSDCKVLDIGGGISHEDVKDITTCIEEIFGDSMPTIIVEPGRHLLNPCIDLRVTVTAIRYKQGEKLVFINSGIYDGLLDVKIKNRKFDIMPEKRNVDEGEECLICGNSADISDVLGRYIMPTKLTVGDRLLILNCGAYCSEMDTIFCKNKRANYIVDS